jgi:hypothetical protein
LRVDVYFLKADVAKLIIRCTAVLLCLVVGVAGADRLRATAGFVRTEDRNHDGRADVWRIYNEYGQLTTVARDTNFDGRSDVHEYYSGGALTRRESDTNFDDRVDLVEEFEPTTHEHVRSLVDVDYDGRADLLILLQRERPVFAQWAGRVATNGPQPRAGTAGGGNVASRTDDDALAPLSDPFTTDMAVRGSDVTSESAAWVGLSASGEFPVPGESATGPVTAFVGLNSHDVRLRTLTGQLSRSPRGPPLS